MKIVQVHNQYQNPTGDDAVVREASDLLKSHGHEVFHFFKTNDALASASLIQKLKVARAMRASSQIRSEFTDFLKANRPDVVHAHNLFPLITPVVFEVCQALAIPVVQTLHNYRLVCVNTLFYRDGHVCEDCLDKTLKEGVKHKCYNGSRLQSYLMADAIGYHHRQDTWNRQVDAFICLSDFARSKFVKGGIQPEKLVVKPNFVKDPAVSGHYEDFWLYAGKLEEQKGLDDFLQLARQRPDQAFQVAGYCDDQSVFSHLPNVTYLGQLKREVLMGLMNRCKGVLFLSKMYEGMPMTILEAFAHKKSVLARKRGAMAEMIRPGENGGLYETVDELAGLIDQYAALDVCQQLGARAYVDFTEHYSGKVAYQALMNVYDSVING